MSRFVALLRGINVGGHNRVRMADLREVCARLGWSDVATHLQSGNVAFTAAADEPTVLEGSLEGALERDLGLSPRVLVRTAEELRHVVEENPFAPQAAADPTKVLVAFLSAEPDDGAGLTFPTEAYRPDEIAGGDRVRYLHLPNGMAGSKLAERLTKRATSVDVTMRNWRTVRALLDLAER